MKSLLRIGMLLCMCLLTCVGWAMAQTAEGNDPPAPFTKQAIDKTDLNAKLGAGKQAIGIFANGHPVTISAGENGKVVLTTTGDNEVTVTYELEDPSNTVVFGGGYDNDVEIESTSVTIESGTIWSVVGGSYGTSSGKGKVKEATVNLNGGTVTKYVVGGGALYSETVTANIKSSENSSVQVGSWVLSCMESGAITEGATYSSSYADSPCKVGQLNWNLQGGSFTYIGLSGGNGSRTYTDNAESGKIENSQIGGGLFGCGPNGQGGRVRVFLTNCSFTKTGNAPIEIAAVNRGKLDNMELIFQQCQFSPNESDYRVYAGATYDWTNGGKQASDLHSVTGSGWDFSGCSKVPFAIGLSDGLVGTLVVSGIQVEVASFTYNSSDNNGVKRAFFVPEGKPWFLFGGLRYTASGDATLTNNGNLTVTVSDTDQLTAAVKSGANNITLNDGLYQISSRLAFNKAITLEGSSQNTVIQRSAAWTGASTDAMISIQADGNSSVSRLVVDGTRPETPASAPFTHGIEVSGSTTNVAFTGVTVQNANAAGLSVKGSTVSLSDFHTNNNLYGGVLLNTDGSNNPHLTVNDGCSFVEQDNLIWADSWSGDDAESYVTLPSDWRKVLLSGGAIHWTNASPIKAVGTTPELVNAVNSAIDGDVILLDAGTYELSTPLVITKAITIKGDDSKSVIRAVADKASFTPYGPNDYNLVTITGAGKGSVKLENLRITGSHGSGLNVQTAMKTYLDKVQLYKNTNAGLLVHSEVEAQFLETEENGWGGVNIDKGTPEYTRKLTIKSNGYNFRENVKIWAEKANCPNPYETVVIEDQEHYYTYRWAVVEGKGGKNWNTDMIYWVTTDKPLAGDYTTMFVSDYSTSVSDGVSYYNANFYADGNPVTVEAVDEHYTKIVNGSSAQDYIVLPYKNRASLYGGAKQVSVTSTSITMEGGQLRNVYGGGYSPVGVTPISRADVLESVTINLNNGAEVSNILQGGGYHYSKVPSVTITSRDAKIGYLMVGGYDQGKTGNDIDTPLAESNNGVQTVNVAITGGEIMVMGCGGGQGYSRTGTSTVNVNGTKIGYLYGTYSNGRADNIRATFTDCTITNQLAAINRGKIDNAQFVFDGCSFGESIKSSVAAIEGWADSDTNGKPVPTITNRVVWRFLNSKTATPTMMVGRGTETTTIEVTGAPAVLNSFRDGAAVSGNTTAYTIGVGNTWIFSNGLSFDHVENHVTLTTNGMLVVPAAYVPALVNNANDGITITLTDQEMSAVVNGMNSADSKADLSGKRFSIECKNGVIASNKAYAAELAAMGKLVKVLSYSAGSGYSLSTETVQEAAKITNLPDSVAYGTQPITLAFNRTGFTASISEGSEFASITDKVLTIKKPGEVTITLTSSGTEVENYTQKLKVTKRIATLVKGLEVDYVTPIDGVTFADDNLSKIYDGTTKIGLKESGTVAFSGLVEGDDIKLAAGYSGVLADANAGYDKPVIVTASLSGTKAAYYQLAPVSIVKATVIPKPLTITARDQVVSYGGTVPYEVEPYSLIGSDKLEGTLKFSCAVKTDAIAGDYADAIKPHGLTSPNYAITFAAGKLTVNAIAPSVEITEAKVVSVDGNKDIALKARLIHNGGGANTPVVTFNYGGTSVNAEKGTDGLYAATLSHPGVGDYTITAQAATGGPTGTSAPVNVSIDELKAQNLTWAPSVLPSLVYGQSMTLGATSDQAAATGAYSYRVVAGENATIDENGVLEATKVGKVTIEAKRAADTNYSAATLTKTIEITPKPITVSVAGLKKNYDGTTLVKSPRFSLTGLVGDDFVYVQAGGVALSYASQNVGDNVAVIVPELTLAGSEAAANYTLVQPTNVTGEITKAPLTIKVKDVTRSWDQRYTKYEFETTGLVNGETLTQAYMGELKVIENGSVLELEALDPNKCPNYAISTESGTLTITKGMPKAVVYGSGASWNAMIVDYQGYDSNDLTLDQSKVASGGKALIMKGDQVLGSSINSKPSPTLAASPLAAAYSLRASSLRGTVNPSWNEASFTSVVYGSEAMTFAKEEDFSYSSTNMSVLTVSVDGSAVTVTPVGVGNATIIAEKTGTVKIWNVTVTPKTIRLTAEMVKTYDGTATATGTVSLGGGVVGTDDVALDLSGITFNYADKNVGDSKAIVPSQNLVLIGTNANNYTINAEGLSGKITAKSITVNDPIAVYYNGQAVHTLNTYPVSGLIAGDVAPINVTFVSADAGDPKSIEGIALHNGNGNYVLTSTTSPSSGTIQRSTLVATLPASASSEVDLKSRIQLKIRETGEKVTANAVGFNPTITTSGSGANTAYYVTGGDTDNYSVVYDRNQIGYQAPVIPGGGGGTVDPDPVIPTVSNPVVAERTATTATVTWEKVSGATSYKLFLYAKKTDSTPLKTYEFDKDGKLKATTISFTLNGLEEGKAYYVETAAYNASGTLLVKKSVELSATPTGIEAISEGSQLYTVKGAIVVAPAEPLQVAIYSVTGHTLFYDEVSYLTQVPAKAGIYVVVVQKGKERVMEKVFVR